MSTFVPEPSEKKSNVDCQLLPVAIPYIEAACYLAVGQEQAERNQTLEDTKKLADDMLAAAREEVIRMKTEVAVWKAEKELLVRVQTFSNPVKLDIGGSRFTTSLTTLTRFPDSMLGVMFSGRHELPLSRYGYYFIDRDGTYFKYFEFSS